MPLGLICLLLGAAVIHAGWNLLLKRATENQLVVFWANLVAAACFLPFVFLRTPLGPFGWRLAAVSAAAEAIYYVLLMTAYRIGDFSLVYPIARGAAPAFLAIGAVVVLGERPGPGGLVGLGLIVTGLFTVGSAGWGQQRERKGLAPGVALALLVALLIAFYSVIDGAAVKREDPLVYVGAVYALTALWLSPIMLHRYGWTALRNGLSAHRGRAVAVGILQALGYSTVLYVFSRGSVGYAGAIRESSVVLGALAGWLWLGEELGARRVLGAVLMFAGVMVIAVAG